MAATFDATPGSTLERITVAVASEAGDRLELPEPLDVPDGWEQRRRDELEPYARAGGQVRAPQRVS